MGNTRYSQTIEIMLEKGYFRTKLEYEKAKKWVAEGVIPKWLEKDIKEYEESEGENANSSNNKNRKSQD